MKKTEIRKKLIKIRKENFYKNVSINVREFIKVLNINKIKKKIIGGYYPYNCEINTMEILKNLEKKNYKISLPKISKNNQMDFYEWSFNDPMLINTFGIPEPSSSKKIYPDILLVPLVAFDEKLNRLGYGGGYYDRYIARVLRFKKVITIGMAYSFQKIKKLTINRHDIRIDHVITEKNFF